MYEGKRATTKDNHDLGKFDKVGKFSKFGKFDKFYKFGKFDLGKFDLNSGGAGGQVEQVAAKPPPPAYPGPPLRPILMLS